jgi:hypothetical protein
MITCVIEPTTIRLSSTCCACSRPVASALSSPGDGERRSAGHRRTQARLVAVVDLRIASELSGHRGRSPPHRSALATALSVELYTKCGLRRPSLAIIEARRDAESACAASSGVNGPPRLVRSLDISRDVCPRRWERRRKGDVYVSTSSAEVASGVLASGERARMTAESDAADTARNARSPPTLLADGRVRQRGGVGRELRTSPAGPETAPRARHRAIATARCEIARSA